MAFFKNAWQITQNARDLADIQNNQGQNIQMFPHNQGNL